MINKTQEQRRLVSSFHGDVHDSYRQESPPSTILVPFHERLRDISNYGVKIESHRIDNSIPRILRPQLFTLLEQSWGLTTAFLWYLLWL